MNLEATNRMISNIICDISTAIPFPTWAGRANGLKIERIGLKIELKKLNVFR